jgi:hypothetical protein
VGHSAGLDAVVDKKIHSPFRDWDQRFFSPRRSVIPTELSRPLKDINYTVILIIISHAIIVVIIIIDDDN